MKRLLLAAAFVVLVAVGGSVLQPAQHASAITSLISFQGKLTNPDGTNVTDSNYSIRFRIYTDPTADSANVCNPGTNTCKWEETQATVAVSAGLFQVSLGSGTALPGNVDFNASALYLGVKVGSDLEMTPRVRLTASPQAFNSDLLDGLDSTAFVQLTPAGQQTGTINISGTITSGAVNGITIGTTIQPSSAGGLTIQSNGANALTLTSGAGATWSTTAGALTVQGFAGTTINTPAAAGATGAVSILTGNSSGGTAGNITVDTGTTSTGTPTVTIAGSNAKAVQIGNSTSNPAVTIDSGSGTIAIGTGGQARTVNIGTGTGNQTVSLGSTSGGSSLNLQAGTGNLNITTQGTGQLNVGANATAQTIAIGNGTGATTVAVLCGTGACDLGNNATVHTTTVGSATGASATTLQAGTGGLSITTTGTGTLGVGNNAVAQTVVVGNATGATSLTLQSGTGGLVLKPITANATAFTLQDSANVKYLVADTQNVRLYVGDPTANTTATLLVLDYKNTTGDPTAVNGGEYYNSANNKFRCAQNSIWADCTTGFNTNILAADQAATQSSTTMQNVTALGFTANANTTYVFDAWVPINDSNATADAKYTFTTPASSTLNIMTTYSGTTAAASVICNITASAQACANTTVNSASHFIQIRGMVAIAGTAGTVQFQFAQNASTAVSFPVVKKGATITWKQSN
jgi:hypothetical protein